MPHIIRNSSLAIALLFTAAPLFTVHADAKSTFMQVCSAKWKAAKAANTVPAGTKWTDFMKTDCGAGAGTDQTSTTPPAATPAVIKTPAKKVANTAGDNFMKNCSAQWKAMKDAGTIPDGLKWTQFVKQSCTIDPVNQASTNDNAVPVEPTDTNYSNIEVKTVDKNGKAFTPGQIAAHQRIKKCAGEWHAAKSAGNLPQGEKWPQFWSACNTRLKTQG